MNTIDRTSILRDLIQTKYGGNQSLFAVATGKKVAQINQYLTGVRNIGEKVAREFEDKLGLHRGYFDGAKPAENTIGDLQKVGVYSESEPIPEGYFAVKEYEARLSCGRGNDIEYSEIDTTPRLYHESFFINNKVKPDDVARFIAEGDSMKPLIRHGYRIAVNTKAKAIPTLTPEQAEDEDNMTTFALLDDGARKNKYTYIDSETGELVLHSQNSKFKDERYSQEYVDEYIRIIGKVIDISGNPNA